MADHIDDPKNEEHGAESTSSHIDEPREKRLVDRVAGFWPDFPGHVGRVDSAGGKVASTKNPAVPLARVAVSYR